MYEMDNFNKIVYYHPHDFLKYSRFSKNYLLICCVAKWENGTETVEDTQKSALSDQSQCLFSPSYTDCIAEKGNKFDCRGVDGPEHEIIKHKTQDTGNIWT
jgi:hypothetical protein